MTIKSNPAATNTPALAIEKRSMAVIEAEIPEPRPFQGRKWLVVRRMIHTSADFEMLNLVRFSPGAVRSGLQALESGCLIVTDTEMARAGIVSRRMEPLGCEVRCLINDPRVVSLAQRQNTTRAHAAVDLAVSEAGAGIYVVGNAPTALLRLLEFARTGEARPKLIIGMPVGFVAAAESKEALMAQNLIPYVTIKGRKGGSALAASVVNALADMALAVK
ncbi:MAG: precorrin-8X methylmutase [Thermodesulfobacteriota bacterium]|nr:precorrin-8X methylmutase [Thermodesulfobacteriota bacterium]